MCGLAPSRLARRAELRQPAAGSTRSIRVLPTGKVEVVTGTAPHGQGHETSWSMIVADRLGVPRRRRRGAPLRHRDLAPRPRHLRLALARGRRQRDLLGVREGHRQGAEHRGAPDGGGGGGPRVRRGRVPRARARRRARCRSRRSRSTAFTAHNLPDGMEPNLTAEASYDPIELHVPVRRAHRGRRDRRGDRARRRSCGTSRSTTAATRSTRSSSTARCTAASSRVSRRRCGRRPRTTRPASCRTVDAGRLPGSVGCGGRRSFDLGSHRHAEPDERDGREGHRRGRARSGPRPRS